MRAWVVQQIKPAALHMGGGTLGEEGSAGGSGIVVRVPRQPLSTPAKLPKRTCRLRSAVVWYTTCTASRPFTAGAQGAQKGGHEPVCVSEGKRMQVSPMYPTPRPSLPPTSELGRAAVHPVVPVTPFQLLAAIHQKQVARCKSQGHSIQR